MEPDVKISIIMPVYNSADSLKNALDSALGQTLREIEVVAVDDASGDNSPEILRTRAAADPRLRVFVQPANLGTLSARNRALREAHGKYALFLDPDDTFLPETAAELFSIAEEKNADIVNFGTNEFMLLPDGSRKQLWNWITPAAGELRGPGAVLKDLMLDKGHYWALCFKLIRMELCRRALAETEDFYCIMAEDFYFYLPIAFHADSIVKVPKNYYNYNIASGITAAARCDFEKFKKTATVLDALARIEAFLKSHSLWEQAPCREAYLSIEQEQLLILWDKWFTRLPSGERAEAARWIFDHAPDKERLISALFEENEYLRENREFLKFAKAAYRLLNMLLPKNSFFRMKLKNAARYFAEKRKKKR